MRSIQSRCSGFMRTERRQVRVARSRRMPSSNELKKVTGRSARARCRPRSAHFAHAVGARSEDHDVQLGRKCRNKAAVILDFFVESKGCGPAALQALRKFAALHERQQFLCGPQSGGGSARTRAFQADFAQVQFR
jgi:hypothetical protein